MIRLPSARFLLAVIALVALLGGVGGVGGLVWNDYHTTQQAARKSLAEVSRLMEEHTRTVLLAVRLQIGQVLDLIDNRPLSALDRSQADRQRLRQIIDALPFGHSIWIFDDQGRVVLTTAMDNPPNVTFEDREYFQALKAGGPDTFISPLIWGRLTGGHLLSVARRLSAPDGSFRGVVAVSVRAEYFNEFYDELNPSDQAVFTILKPDGSIVLRNPLPEREPARMDTSQHPFPLIRSLTQGDYRSVSRIDGIERLVSFRTMADYGLIVLAGMGSRPMLEDWKARTISTAVFGAVVLTMFLAPLVLALFSAGRESRAIAAFKAKTDELQAALADKDVLFQEVHHRVKNNLQIVASLLTMQSLKLEDETARTVLQQALDRIEAMGLVHRMLYMTDDAAETDMGEYLGRLVEMLAATHGARERAITFDVRAPQARMDLGRAVPLGLIAAEGITNALKHAFVADGGGCVRVCLERENANWVLSVGDDGQGIGLTGGNGIGMTLIHSLARQLGGQARVAPDQSGGTLLTVLFPAN